VRKRKIRSDEARKREKSQCNISSESYTTARSHIRRQTKVQTLFMLDFIHIFSLHNLSFGRPYPVLLYAFNPLSIVTPTRNAYLPPSRRQSDKLSTPTTYTPDWGTIAILMREGTSLSRIPYLPRQKSDSTLLSEHHPRPIIVPHYSSLVSHYGQRCVLWFARHQTNRQAPSATPLVATG